MSRMRLQLWGETMNEKIYEVWYEFYDGTMANSRGYRKRIKTFASKEKAENERDKLNAKVEYENPYYIKEVELDD